MLVKRADLPFVNPVTFGLRGYASIYSVLVPSYREIVMPGAFESVLARLTKPLPVMFGHKMWNLQIGETIHLESDDRGLYFEAAMFATQEAVDVLGVVHGRGRMDASFSFDYGEYSTDDDGITQIHSFSQLYELGPVTWGANPAAYVELMPMSEAKRSAPPLPAAALEDLADRLHRAAASLKEM